MKATMVMGAPASGKSTTTESLLGDAVHLNRDIAGGATLSLLPKFMAALQNGQDVIIDGLFPTAARRKPFVDAAKKCGAPISCYHVTTSIEDSQINALHRMWRKYATIHFTAQKMKEIKDPGTFPIVVLFQYRKELEKPSTAEGFDKITPVKFVRRSLGYTNKAVLVDYDGTLRESTGDRVYPIAPHEVEVKPGVGERLAEYKSQGYIILGVSNQSGVGKGEFTIDEARACFDKTHEDIGITFDYEFCPHKVPPISCYCRKPQSGMGVKLIESYYLNPAECIMVGDQTTDKTFAKRLGFQFEHASGFFK